MTPTFPTQFAGHARARNRSARRTNQGGYFCRIQEQCASSLLILLLAQQGKEVVALH